MSDKNQQIVIDCAPGSPRPGDLLEQVIEGTGLVVKPDCSRLFGEWTWDYNEVPVEVWEKAKPILEQRLTKLYNDGVVRYVEW